MSKPIRCETCGDLVGVYSTPFVKRRFYGPCPGEGNHKREKIEKPRGLRVVFGQLFERWDIYPETHTESHYFRWIGGARWQLRAAVLKFGDVYDETKKEWCFRSMWRAI